MEPPIAGISYEKALEILEVIGKLSCSYRGYKALGWGLKGFPSIQRIQLHCPHKLRAYQWW
jgi:hypothetical protein